MDTTIEKVTLKMFEVIEMSESSRVEKDGKISFVKTGNKIKKTQGSFIDEWGAKLVFIIGDEYQKLEGKTGILTVKLIRDDFNGVNKLQFKHFEVA